MEETVVSNRWLPPAPHREEVLKAVEQGRAAIRERGHDIAPLLVFEGEGGVMELPKVRYLMTHRGMQLVAAGESSAKGQTRHPDVCGSIDALQGLLRDEPATAEVDADILRRLVEDARYMIERMRRRGAHYAKFAADVAALCQRMDEVEAPDAGRADQDAERMLVMLGESPDTVGTRRDELCDLGEVLRDVANKLEDSLSAQREAAMGIGSLYERVKGGRSWTGQPGSSGGRE